MKDLLPVLDTFDHVIIDGERFYPVAGIRNMSAGRDVGSLPERYRCTVLVPGSGRRQVAALTERGMCYYLLTNDSRALRSVRINFADIIIGILYNEKQSRDDDQRESTQ